MKSLAAVLLTAFLTALSFPPFDVAPAAFVALVPLLLATGRGGGARALLTGWLAGWAAFTAVVWWVLNTITHYGGIPWSLAIPILLLMTWGLGFFWGLFAWARGRILKGPARRADFLISPLLWVALEYARAHLPDVAFPWALMGYTQYRNVELIQAADIFGVWVVSYLVVSVNCAVAFLLRGGVPQGMREAVLRLLPAAGAALLLLGAWQYGLRKTLPDDEAAGLEVVVIQGNVEQDVKWDPAYRRETFDIYRALTEEGAGEGADLVVWPETATPFTYRQEPGYRREILDLARRTGSPILFGSPAREVSEGEVTLRNRAYLVSADGEDAGWYDKVHLVPFGEYVPWKRLLFFVNSLVQAVGEFSPGAGPVTLEVPGVRAGVLICYEVIFPDLVRRSVNGGAEILVNITNDAWFGRTAASRQHFSTLVFRAVENRRPVARAANTGISGFVDRRGRILQTSGLFVRGHYRAGLHPSSERTVYGRIGDLFPMGCALLGLLLVAGLGRGRRESAHRPLKDLLLL